MTYGITAFGDLNYTVKARAAAGNRSLALEIVRIANKGHGEGFTEVNDETRELGREISLLWIIIT